MTSHDGLDGSLHLNEMMTSIRLSRRSNRDTPTTRGPVARNHQRSSAADHHDHHREEETALAAVAVPPPNGRSASASANNVPAAQDRLNCPRPMPSNGSCLLHEEPSAQAIIMPVVLSSPNHADCLEITSRGNRIYWPDFLESFFTCTSSNTNMKANCTELVTDIGLSSSTTLDVSWGIAPSERAMTAPIENEELSPPPSPCPVMGFVNWVENEGDIDDPVATKHRRLTLETTGTGASGSSNSEERNETQPDATGNNNCNNNNVPAWSRLWTRTVLSTHGPILYVLQYLAGLAARFPRRTIAGTTMLSLGLLVTGLFTNFNLDVNNQFSPRNSAPMRQGYFIREHFPSRHRYLTVLLHDGLDEVDEEQPTNILGTILVERAFHVIDVVTKVSGYRQLCTDERITYDYFNPMTGEIDCEVYAVTRFWANNQTLFEQSTEEEVLRTLSGSFFPDGTPVSREHLYGMKGQMSSETLTNIRSSMVSFLLPSLPGTREVEREALGEILRLRQQWRVQDGPIFLEVQSDVSLSDEFTRAIEDDLPLVPAIFVIMSVFTALAFARWHKVRSRALLGFGAVVMVLLSIAGGFGIMFICGTPFSNLTQILPFIIFGVGLDDAFILMGSYERTDEGKETTERIRETIDDIGLSITLTSLTSAVAFGLGCQSSVFAVVWLCRYAVPLILLVFLYTPTFFVALLVLDEQRIKSGRFDCCVCLGTKRAAKQTSSTELQNPGRAFGDRIMAWYANILLRPITQTVIIIGFGGLFVACAISAAKLTEEFNFKDALPRDSYVIDFTEAYSRTTNAGMIEPYIYFRYVDFESAETRAQMRDYVSDLAESSFFAGPPRVFWLDFFELNAGLVPDLNFTAQMDHFLSNELYAYLFTRDISRDDRGNVISSRVRMRINVDTQDANDQIAAMKMQELISKAQPINAERQDDLAFFCYDGVFKLWEFLRIAKRELLFTTIVSVVAVTLVALIFIPHWSAVVIVFPLVCILFVDLLGVLQWAGLHINPVSYVSLAMSIGLLVDYVIHIVFRFYELSGNRREKMVAMLRTMGVSIFLGGTTTWLGTIPLMFSSSDLFETVYVTFLGIVVLGMGHGLILLPVLLSLFGPETQVSMFDTKQRTIQSVDVLA